MLGTLRQTGPRAGPGRSLLDPAPGLADLDRLAAGTRDAGVRVEVQWRGPRRPLPAEIDLSAFRIIQDAVANVIRHAGTGYCQVSIDCREELDIEVTDDGRGGVIADTGYGIAGMRERADLLGGQFTAGPAPRTPRPPPGVLADRHPSSDRCRRECRLRVDLTRLSLYAVPRPAYRRDMRYRFAAALVAAAASLMGLAACSGNPHQDQVQTRSSAAQKSPAQASPANGGVSNCAGPPSVSPLPAWARDGFSPPDIAMPHVTGTAGNIVAVLWATPYALHVPALPPQGNKILWVSRVSSGPMTIRATLAGSTRTATVNLPDGPGPSYVDMPAPGCWTLHLSWGGHTDQLSLRYVR